MINVINYIGKLLTKERKGTARSLANNFNRVSVGEWGKIIIAGDNNPGKREYNKANLWIAFNRYDLDAAQHNETSGECSLKSCNRAMPRIT
ncbi:MAG: hypothetical protein V4592_09305 [Bacteroidota bacterium]